MTFQDIIKEVESSTWQPEFEWVSSIEEVADRINAPHEDYPIGVKPTIQMIGLMKDEQRITWADACNIQKFLQTAKLKEIEFAKVMADNEWETFGDTLEYTKLESITQLPNQHISLGLRKTNVQVGSWAPPHPMFLQELIDKIFPVFLTDMPFIHERQKQIFSNIELIEWYKWFETIHPFEDLNGRVGGIIVAVLSHSNGKFLAPKKDSIE